MKLRTKATAVLAGAALAMGLGVVTAPVATANPTSRIDLTSSSVGPLYVAFHTGYKSWMQPGWSFGPDVYYFRLYAGQCVKLSTGVGWRYECNNATWDPNNQQWRNIYLPDWTTIVERYK